MKDFLSRFNNPNELFAYLSITIAVLLYGTTLTATKICLTYYSTAHLMTFRMLVSSLLFIPLIFTLYKHIKIDVKDYKLIFLMMLSEPCLYFIFETNALKYTTSGQAGIVSSLEPVILVIAARIILKEKFVKIIYLGLFISIIGSVLLSLSSDVSELAPNPLLGNFLELMAIILTDTCVITTKYLMEKYPPFYLAGIDVIGGLVFFAALNFIEGDGFNVVMNASVFIIIYLGILTVVTYALYNFAICILPASKFSPFLFILPVAAVIFGWFFLGETFNLKQFGSSIIIFAGIYICQLNTKKKLVKTIKKLPFSDFLLSGKK
ncbi:MAG: DMT family transporter [Candidatus Gastranaerophilales bacterium]|nr:DMT family transporter [Candidatus Gastranaerophilales bacterium]